MNRAFLGAYRKGLNMGRRVAHEPQPQYEEAYRQCPYNQWASATHGGDKEKPTWERAFARFWMEGFDDGFRGCDCQNPCPASLMGRDQSTWHYSNSCPVHN